MKDKEIESQIDDFLNLFNKFENKLQDREGHIPLTQQTDKIKLFGIYIMSNPDRYSLL